MTNILRILSVVTVAFASTALLASANQSDSWTASESSTAKAGAPIGGLEVALYSRTRAFHVGEPFDVTLEIRATKSQIRVIAPDLRSLIFHVSNASGGAPVMQSALPAAVAAPISHASLGIPLRAGISAFKVINLSELYSLRPGTYSVSADVPVFIVNDGKRLTLESSSVALEALP